MRIYAFLIGALLLGGVCPVAAQTVLSGRVLEKGSDRVLYPATVFNKTAGTLGMTDQGGNYHIVARKGDEVFFSYLGYKTDSLTIKGTESAPTDIYLEVSSQELPEVEIGGLTDYQRDSLQRRQLFHEYLDKPPVKLVDNERSPKNNDAGFGLVLHPFTRAAEKKKRRFLEQYAVFEQNAFIDSRYTADLVTRLTGLSGDALHAFMQARRPPYGFARISSDLEFQSWIKQQYEDYIRKTR
ncbi:carboxypeptidase-like regulatory domain-containing protein [Compostibacter hankyongensis]|uniref:Carboxypeptidase-like regulatory domain-containing protein n=1 Tax=Compostibacter hankyongensis TaxID=1007089 RepID=A0ABP8FR84_9BACT